MKTIRIRLMAVAMGIFLAAFGAQAADSAWTTTSGTGYWDDPANWAAGVPGATDQAIFSMPFFSTFTVQLTNNASAYRINADQGVFDMTLDMNGYTLDMTSVNTATQGLRMATANTATQHVTFASSAPGGVFNANLIYAGVGTARPMYLTMTGSNLTVNLNGAAGDVNILPTGAGSWTLSDGVTMTCTRAILFSYGDGALNNTWTMTDPGTSLTNSSVIYLGKTNTNMPIMVVSNGARYTSANLIYIAQGGDAPSSFKTNANGKLIVSGAGSYFQSTYIYMGNKSGNADGTAGSWLTVEDGGYVKATARIDLGMSLTTATMTNAAPTGYTVGGTNYLVNFNAYGEMRITGAGSTVETGAGLNVGTGANGLVLVDQGGKLWIPNQNVILGRGYEGIVTNTGSRGVMVVSNAGSVVQIQNLQIGVLGTGAVIVADNARLSATNNNTTGRGIFISNGSSLTVSDALVETRDLNVSNSVIRIELGARDHADAYIQLSGALNIVDPSANLEIAFLDDFDYSGLGIGDKISLIKYGSASGNFDGWTDMVTTVSSGDYEFLYNKVGDEIYLDVNVIPEPGTLGLIGAGLGMAALLRRRRR